MAMTARERQQILALIAFLGVAAAGGFWLYWRAPKVQEQRDLRVEIDSLRAQVDSARRDLASGTVESIRQLVEDYEGTLERMKELVPAGSNEVTTLIDQISARAKRNGVTIGEFNPLAVEIGEAFDIYRYRWTVFGYYNDIGVLMSDIAQLPRIMVPYDVALTLATAQDQRAFGDTTGALLRAQFLLRTFVKPAALGSEGGAGGGL